MEFYVITDLTPVWLWELSVLYHRHHLYDMGKFQVVTNFTPGLWWENSYKLVIRLPPNLKNKKWTQLERKPNCLETLETIMLKKLASKIATSGLSPVRTNTKGRDQHQQTRRAGTDQEAPRDETNTKGRDRHHVTRRAGTDQEAPRDEINTKERPKQRQKQENTIKD